MLHMALEKCVKQIGAPFAMFTKLNVSSSGMVKVFFLYDAVVVVKKLFLYSSKIHRFCAIGYGLSNLTKMQNV